MKKLIMVMFLLVPFSNVKGAKEEKLEKEFHFATFDQAESSNDFIKFEMESTKLGLVTTSFSGFAKSFKIEAEQGSDSLNNITVTVDVGSLDTDIDARNEKMWDLCFERTRYPTLRVKVPSFKLGAAKAKVRALLWLKGRPFPLNLEVEMSKAQGSYLAKGTGVLDFFSLKMEDPSIAIASIEKEIKLSFSFRL